MRHCRLLNKFCALLCIAILTTGSSFAQSVPRTASRNTIADNSNTSRQQNIKAAAAALKAGNAAQAYALLTPYQSELAGDPEFDYLLGIASLDSGKINEAIFALERVLAVRPNHLQARAEIARAYLAAGEISASKEEFEAVQKQNPPKEVSATIQKYLDIIETGIAAKKFSLRAYVEVMAGSDSNVNSATSNRQIAVPLFGGALMNLNAAGVANSDTFGSIATGFSLRNELKSGLALVGGANISKRNNATQLEFNTGNADANVGISLGSGKDSYLVVLQFQSFALDNVRYRDAIGMTGQWQRNLNSGSQLSSYLQYSSLSYPTQTTRDADRYVLGGAYATSLGSNSATVIYSGIYAGAEKPRQSGVAYLGNTLYGGRIGAEHKLGDSLALLASASMEARMHDGSDTLFLVKRSDTQYDLKISMNYIPAKAWTISPSVAYTSNNSNIVINKYDRTVIAISARRDFE
jgi:tetratricopeptide (TPR) repeat protein